MTQPRYATLDAWRGLACLGVIAFHSTAAYVADGAFLARVQTEGGTVADWLCWVCGRLWIGVPLFFVISGYCIAAAAVNTVERGRPIRTFLIRRLRRIYPPLWIFLILTATALMVLPDAMMPGPTAGFDQPIPRPQSLGWWHWFGQFTLTEEWRGNVVGPPKNYFAGHLWTLCYEEQFYLVMAACAAVARRWLFVAVAAISAFVALRLIDVIVLPFAVEGFFFDGLWLAFAAGVSVYYRCHRATPILKFALDGLLVAALVWAARSVPDLSAFSTGIPSNLVVAFAAALLVGWAYRFDSFTATARGLAPLRWCGERCYSLYLMHAPIALIVSWCFYSHGATTTLDTVRFTLPTCLVLSLLAGWAFHRFVERYFLNNSTVYQPCDEASVKMTRK